MEFTLKSYSIKPTAVTWLSLKVRYDEIWGLLRHEKYSEIQVVATLLSGNVWLFNGKRSLEHQASTNYFRNFRFLEACVAQV